GPSTYPVAGEVTFNGEPIPDGYISFASANGVVPPVAAPIVDGKYSTELTEGTKKVSIDASRFVGEENPVMGLRPRETYIPEEYNLETTLQAEVTPGGQNVFDFPLEGSN